MDTATADYRIGDGVYGKVRAISGNVLPAQATQTSDPYLQIQGTTYISYHAVGLNIHSMALRPENCGVYYLNDFAGDSMVASQVTTFGVALSVDGVPDEETMANFEQYTAYSQKSFGMTEDATGTLLTGILKQTNNERNNQRNADLTVYGRAYIQVGDTYLFGIPRQGSLKELVVAADAGFEALDAQQKEALAEMHRQFPTVLGSWELKNLERYITEK